MSMRIPIAKRKRQTTEKGILLQLPKLYKYKTKFSMIARTAMYIQQSAQDVCRLQGLKRVNNQVGISKPIIRQVLEKGQCVQRL